MVQDKFKCLDGLFYTPTIISVVEMKFVFVFLRAVNGYSSYLVKSFQFFFLLINHVLIYCTVKFISCLVHTFESAHFTKFWRQVEQE